MLGDLLAWAGGGVLMVLAALIMLLGLWGCKFVWSQIAPPKPPSEPQRPSRRGQ